MCERLKSWGKIFVKGKVATAVVLATSFSKVKEFSKPGFQIVTWYTHTCSEVFSLDSHWGYYCFPCALVGEDGLIYHIGKCAQTTLSICDSKDL